MMKHIFVFIKLICLIFLLGACADDEDQVTSFDTQKLDVLMQNFLDQNSKLSGVVAAINQPNRIDWEGALGEANTAQSEPVSVEHQFITASITKTFVATVILQLVEEEKLSLDDTIDKFLTDEIVNNIANINGQVFGSQITISQLLSHRSGIYDYLEGGVFHLEGLATPGKRYTSIDRITYAVENGSPYSIPGDDFAYSNTNFALLDLIIESITSNSLDEELRQRIFIPLSLENTFFAFEGGEIQGLMRGYFDGDDITGYITNLDWASPDGGVISNTADLQKFTRALFTGNLFQQASTLEAMLSFNSGYGLGVELIVDDQVFGRIYGHTGATPGYTSIMAYVERLDAVIIISGNQTEQFLDNGSYLINQFLTTLFFDN